MDDFWKEIDKYQILNTSIKTEWEKFIVYKTIKKHDFLLMSGDIPQNIGFIKKGLMSYYYTDRDGNSVIKKFFSENSFIASTSALTNKSPSLFTIEALEDTVILEFRANHLKYLINKYQQVALLYIKYLERNWIIDKEQVEIDYKYKTAKQRYSNFLAEYPHLIDRLKQHQLASFLGITPTQLSRIRK